MNRPDINQMLECRERTLRTLPGKLLLGSTGARLFVDYLDKAPGFVGRVDFIHKLNLPGLFTVTVDQRPFAVDTARSVWRPAYLEMNAEHAGVSLRERKLITWKDVAVSFQRWKNRRKSPVTLRFTPTGTLTPDEAQGVYHTPELAHGLTLTLAFAMTGLEEDGSLILAPGAEAEVVAAAAVGIAGRDTAETLLERARKQVDCPDGMDARMETHAREYDRWFEQVPRFDCDEPLLTKTWWYRWFLLRHNYAEPACGLLEHGVFYEGRSHKVSKALYAPSGHEFTQFIPLSTPLQLMDCRWQRKPYECEQAALTLADSRDKDGLFATMMVDKRGAYYGNFAVWALYQLTLVHPGETDFLKPLLPVMKQSIRDFVRVFCDGTDVLPICRDHKRTGKEYQPSFWYFTGFPRNARDPNGYTPLKRVDLAVYLYLNALGAARLCEAAGDADAHMLDELAQQVKNDILTKMWDSESGFYYDLHYQTGEQAKIRNVVGVYPLWAGLGMERLQPIETLLSPKDFALGDGFASVARNSPAFSAQGGWQGDFFKGRNGCMWNGPSWPYTTGIALDALAAASKAHDHRFDEDFARLLTQYSLEHYRMRDLEQPYLVEHYDSITGEALSDEPDYLHSYYIDLIVRHVAGITPTANGVDVDPLDIGLDWYRLEELPVKGHLLDVEYRRSEYYRVRVDGQTRYEVRVPAPTSLAL